MGDTRKFNGKTYHFKYIFEGDIPMKRIDAIVKEYKEKGYYGRNQRKFRDFKIRNKKKIYIQDMLIEKTGYAIDTSGEKHQLSVDRFIKMQKQLHNRGQKRMRPISRRRYARNGGLFG